MEARLFPKGDNPALEPPVSIRHTANVVMNLAGAIEGNNDVVHVFSDVERHAVQELNRR